MKTESQKEHHWLQRFVGEWTFEGEAAMEPGKPPEKFRGTERVRTLGGLWILAEGRGDLPEGGTATTLMTLGYDPRKGRFVGSFIGSMMTHQWPYDGALDAAERVLTLDSEGPGMADQSTMAKFRDMFTFESDDHRILTAETVGDDGAWHRFMTAHYRRQR